jgi:cytochrome P450
MPVLTFDTHDPAVLADPFPTYRRLRYHGGPSRTPDGAWVLTSYDEVRSALRDHARFSCAETNGLSRRRLAVLVGTDPPEHSRLRRAAASFFAAASRDSWLPRVERRVHDVIVEALGATRIEAATKLCEAIPLAVLAELMGVDCSALTRLVTWSTSGQRVNRRQVVDEFFRTELDRRPGSPGPDLISSTMRASSTGDQLSDDEIVGHCVLMLAAGVDAPRDLLANILAHRGTADVEEPWPGDGSAIVSYVEEAMRFFSPVQGVFRTTRVPVRLRGHDVGAGERVLLLLGSANRDDAVYFRADRMEPTRYASSPRAAAHLGLGGGVHACLGAALARVVAITTMRTLAELQPVLRLAGPPIRGRNACFRRVVRLDMTVGRRAPDPSCPQPACPQPAGAEA